MRRFVAVIGCLFVLASLAMAADDTLFRIGGHASYSTGGDVQKSNVGFGGQLGWLFNEYVGLEISGSKYKDEVTGAGGVGRSPTIEGDVSASQLTAAANNNASLAQFANLKLGDVDITTFAITLQLGMDVVPDTVRAYVGGGANYTMYSVKYNLSELSSAVGVDLQAALNSAGASFDITVDNALGYHGCAGLEFTLTDSVQLFAEYRYIQIPEVKTKVTVTAAGQTATETAKDKVTGGLVRAGVNFTI